MQGIFNFINKAPPVQQKPTKRTFPRRMFGVSQQSPAEFKLSHTLINLDGYLWKQPSEHYLSELRYNSVVGSNHLKTTFSNQHRKRLDQFEFCFKRKKGLLSEFLDNHAWKKSVIPLLGAERSEEGRSLRNIEYEKIKEDGYLRRSSLHNIRAHYSQRQKQEKSARKDKSPFHHDRTVSIQRQKHRLPNTLRLNSIETFEKFIVRPQGSIKQKSSERNSFSVDKANNQDQRMRQTMNISYKSKRNSTYEDSESMEMRDDTKMIRRHPRNQSLLIEPIRRSRRQIPALDRLPPPS